MATTKNPSSVIVVDESNSFPTGAIVIIALGGYMLIFSIVLLIRKCVINKGGTFCPVWCSEVCACQNCCNSDPNDPGCYASIARVCDCNVPNKRQCMDSICPSKQRCNETFCSCFSTPTDGECCNNCSGGDCNWCGDCGDCCNCNDCKDCCGDCECSCCTQPDSINCCCIEVKLSNASNRHPPPNGYPNQPGGYYGQHPGYVNHGGPMNMQPSAYASQSSGFPMSSNQNMGGNGAFPLNQSYNSNFQSTNQMQQHANYNRPLAPMQQTNPNASTMFQAARPLPT